MCVCLVGVDRVSGLGSILYGTTLRGHVPSDLAFRSHLGSSMELSCLPELGAVFFAISGDQQRGVPLHQYVEQKYGEDWIHNPEAVRFVEGEMMIEEALMFGDEVPTSEPISMRGTKRRRDEPEPTAEGTSGGTAAALPVVSQMNGNPDGAWPVLMRHRRATRLTKNLIMVSEIRRLCADRTADPAATLSAIADVLATKTDSEDEDDGSGRRVMLPPDEVVGCDQQ